MTDLSEISTSKGGITNPTRICSRHDCVADSTEISGKDDSVTNFTCKEQDQASPRRGPSSGACSWLPLRGHKMKTWRTVASRRKKSCVKDTGKQVMRRRSSVKGVNTLLRRDKKQYHRRHCENVYKSMLSRHKWSSGSPSTLHHITSITSKA